MTEYPIMNSTLGRHYDLVSWDGIMTWDAIMTSYLGTPL